MDIDSAATPYAGLTPDRMLDALETVGLRGDGRMLALNSYENRVYQFLLEDPVNGMSAVVAKFYRPERWSDAAIEEEHAYTRELAEREIPVVAPLSLQGATLHHVDSLRFAVFPRRGEVNWFALAVGLGAFAGMWRWKWGVIPVVLSSGALGWVYHVTTR